MNEIKFGVVGYGSIAEKHIKLIKKIYPKSDIKILKHKKNKKFQSRLNFFYKEKLFFKNKFDYIFLCNPCTRHIEYLQKSIKYKVKNIFVEKPISNNFNEIKKFQKKYFKFKNKILVGYVLLYNKLFLKTFNLLERQKIGKIISATVVCNSNFKKWRKNKKFYKTVSANKNLGGGVLNELSHELSYSLKLFGSVEKVFSKLYYQNHKKIDVETEAKIYCLTKNKIDLGIFINFLSNKEERYCEIVGTKSKLLLDLKNKKIILNDKKIYHINENKNQMYEDQLNFFFHNIKNKKKIILEKFNNASETVKFIKAIKLSNYKKKFVRIN